MKEMYQYEIVCKAFENAKSKGLKNPGDFMYMYSGGDPETSLKNRHGA